jgi:hypothetical protein
MQQDATLHSLFISGNCSGSHTTVSTASGICLTVTAICRYRGRGGTGLSVLWVAYTTHSTLKPDAVDTVVCAPDDGRKYHSKHIEQVPDINKLCNVAPCWIYIGILLEARPILHISRIRVNVEVRNKRSCTSVHPVRIHGLQKEKALFPFLEEDFTRCAT